MPRRDSRPVRLLRRRQLLPDHRREELHTAVAPGLQRARRRRRRPRRHREDLQGRPQAPPGRGRRPKLLSDALAEHRRTHGHQPARIVLDEVSQFSPAEVGGFQGAADEREIDFLELIWIQRRGAPHLFRAGQLPPLRGTSVQLDPRTLLLYTRGPSAMMALPRPDLVDGRPTHRLLDPALLRPARARRALPTGQDA